jgi:hypothetical protein
MNPNTKYVYEYSLKFFKNLKHMSVFGCLRLLSIDDLASINWLSLNISKLCVKVGNFGDCFALLDGRLKQLTTFIVNVNTPYGNLSTIYNMVSLYINRWFSFQFNIFKLSDK